MGKAVAKCPPYRLIASVADGDEKAIEKMLQFYDAYLSKCYFQVSFLIHLQ